MNAPLDRRGLLCSQQAPSLLTGIDFVQVVDPGDQRDLLVFFVVDPTLVQIGAGPATMVDGTLPFPQAFGGLVRATAVGGGESLPVLEPTGKEWRQITIGTQVRTVLALHFDHPGDFSNYRMIVDHASIDPFFNNVEFSFKQGCDTGFDCEPDCDCPEADLRDVEIDYLARDFDSLSGALNDFAAQYYPEWGERIIADQGVMLQELMAALGDEFAYVQDRYARENNLQTATQRRSRLRLAALVDYTPDPGSNGSALLSLDMVKPPLAALGSLAQTLAFKDRLALWAVPEGRAPIPFELGTNLADDTLAAAILVAHWSWNQMQLHTPDAGEPCLEIGATECLLKPAAGNTRLPLASQMPAGTPDWIGRRMILWSRPRDPGLPVRAWPVTIEEVDKTVSDALQPWSPGQPLRLTRVRWKAEEALPFAIRMDETVMLGNVAPASAGETRRERFRIGSDIEAKAAWFVPYPRAIERQGPTHGGCCERSIAMLYGLRASEAEGVNFTGSQDHLNIRRADIALRELDPSGNPLLDQVWNWQHSLLEANPDDEAFTLEPGIVRPVVHYLRNGDIFEHSEYASDAGWTIRFGGGDFGRTPADGSAFEATYRTLIGRRSNLAAGTITVIDPPDGSPRHPSLVNVAAVRNPLPASGGTDPESAERIRETAPEAWRALPLNAIRDEHYREIAERELDWAQRANAVTRWTGSWPTTFVTADPHDATRYSAAQRDAFAGLVDQIRMAGHQALIRDPEYLSLDLEVSLCVAPGHFGGDVREAVINALTGQGLNGAPALLEPDAFTFGQPLYRSAIEARVQSVPGVLGVTGICVRERGTLSWRPFDEPEIKPGANTVLHIDNDPLHPERGSVRVHLSESAAHTAGCACCTS